MKPEAIGEKRHTTLQLNKNVKSLTVLRYFKFYITSNKYACIQSTRRANQNNTTPAPLSNSIQDKHVSSTRCHVRGSPANRNKTVPKENVFSVQGEKR